MAIKVLCPLCNRRIFDIITATMDQVVVEIKCPHCRKIVKVEFHMYVSAKTK